MAVRLNKRHQSTVIDKIQSSQLVNALNEHALGERDMTPTQVRAAEVLLRKTMADLKQTDHTGEVQHHFPGITIQPPR
jgi:hypothetical protein